MEANSTTRRIVCFEEAPDVVTAGELEALLRIDVKTIYSYVQRGLIPHFRMQSNVRFRKREILEWIEEHSYRPRPRGGNSARRRA